MHLLLVLVLGLHVVDAHFGNVNVGDILDLVVIELFAQAWEMRMYERSLNPGRYDFHGQKDGRKRSHEWTCSESLTGVSGARHENFVRRLDITIENALDTLISLVPVERLGVPVQ